LLSIDICVPVNAQEIYISAQSIKATYLNVKFGEDDEIVNGYYTIDLSYATPLSKTKRMTTSEATSQLAKTYNINIKTDENTYMNSFDIVFAFRTPDGTNRYVHIPVSIKAIPPYKNQIITCEPGSIPVDTIPDTPYVKIESVEAIPEYRIRIGKSG
jgi:hypothetical protein